MPSGFVTVDGINIAALNNELRQKYSRQNYFEPAERSDAEYFSGLKRSADKLVGGAYNWSIDKSYGQAGGSPDEGDEWTAANPRRRARLSVSPVNVDSSVEITKEAIEQSGSEGSESRNIVAELVDEANIVLMLRAEMLTLGRGNGVLATVEGNTSASTDFVCEIASGGALRLRPGQRVDIADAASGGTVQVANVQILNIEPITHTVTLDTAVTLLDDWVVVAKNTYGKQFPVGLERQVDNGSLGSTIYGVTRTGEDKLLSTVQGTDADRDVYSEDLVQKLLIAIRMKSGMVPTTLLTNEGIALEHIAVASKDRIYNIDGPNQPAYNLGGNHLGVWFQFGSKKLPVKVNTNIAPRMLFALTESKLEKGYSQEANWEDLDNGGPLIRKPGGQTWTNVLTGNMRMRFNTVARAFNVHGKRLGLKDPKLAGD